MASAVMEKWAMMARSCTVTTGNITAVKEEKKEIKENREERGRVREGGKKRSNEGIQGGEGNDAERAARDVLRITYRLCNA